MSCPDRRILSFTRRRSEPRPQELRPLERPLPSPFVYLGAGPVRTLNARQLEHRRLMLDHLQSRTPPCEAASSRSLPPPAPPGVESPRTDL